MKAFKKLSAALLTLCLCVSCFSFVAHAADGRISFTDPSTAVGDEVEVKCVVRSTSSSLGNMEVKLSYDTASLKFESGDGVKENGGSLTYTGTGGSTETSFTMKFQALKEGSTKVEVSGATIASDVGTTLTLDQGNSTVKIAAGDPSKIKSDSKSSKAGNAADKTVTWASDITAVAKVTSDGVVYAIAEGTANVTAKTANGKTATIAVTVSTVKADSVKLSASKVTLTSIGASKTVKATVNPTNTTDKTVTWSSSNKKVATVDKNGKIVAKGNGKATITVKTANGKKATVKVTVKQATKKVVLKVGKKVVTGKTYTLKEGKKATVKATVTDAKGKKVTSGNQKIKWTTSNKKVATISKSGKITAKKAGTVKITAKTADGKKVTFKVKVK